MCLGELWRVCLVVGPVGHLISDAFNVIQLILSVPADTCNVRRENRD